MKQQQQNDQFIERNSFELNAQSTILQYCTIESIIKMANRYCDCL